jgi:flavin reductase (DIM6/NTAB) family NADH-FMN oxidoreductase RutF
LTERAPDGHIADFRALMGSFASSVTVATSTDTSGAAAGMTATAISSVSLEPPMLLICVGNTSSFHGVMQDASQFALSVLAHDQASLSEHFAASHPDPFSGVNYERDDDGFILLQGAVAHIRCLIRHAYEAGDHTVWFGEVVGGRVFDRPPLVRFRGTYTKTEKP